MARQSACFYVKIGITSNAYVTDEPRKPNIGGIKVNLLKIIVEKHFRLLPEITDK